MKNSALLTVLLAVLAVLPPRPAFCANPPPPEVARALTMPGYWETATPAQVRALVGKYSLAGVRAEVRHEPAYTPLMLAAWSSPHDEIIDFLIRAGCAVNAEAEVRNQFRRPGATDEYGDTETEDLSAPLHFAVLNPRPAVLAALLRHKPDLDTRADAPAPFSALELAVRRPGRTEHLKLLLEAGARPKPRPRGFIRDGLWRLFLGYTDASLNGGPIGSAFGILVSPEEAAAKTRLLLAHGVPPDADALARALAAGQNEAARLLLDAGVDPAATIENNSMLYYALFRPGNREGAANSYRVFDVPRADPALIRRLLRAGGRLEGNGWLALACKSGNLDVVRLLAEAGAPYTTKGNELIFAALSSNIDCADVIEYLLSLGFSPTAEGQQRGISPLDATTDHPRQKPRCALALVKAGADPSELLGDLDRAFAVKAGILDSNGNIQVRADAPSSAEQRRLEEARREILGAARKNPKDALYWPLFYSVAAPDEVKEIIGGRSLAGTRVIKTEQDVSLGHGPAAQALILALPVLIFQKEFWTGKRTIRQEYTPLAEAAGTTPHPEVIHLLVKAGCKVRDLNYEALQKALFNPNPAVLEAVLSYKPDVNKVSIFYFGSLLHYLTRTNPQEFRAEHFRLLLAAGADPNVLSGKDKDTPLLVAAYHANAEAGRLLLAAGADPNHVNRVGDTALDRALNEGAYGLALDILKAGGRGKAPLTNLAEAKAKPISPAERQERDEVLPLLLKMQGQDSADARGSLAAAAKEGNLELLRLLLAGQPGRAALNSALSAAMVNDGDPNKARKGAEKPAALLLAAGADPNARIDTMDSYHSGNFGLPFLCFAARVHSPDLADLLLKAGADVNIRADVSFSGVNITPLMILGVFPPRPASRENLEPFLRAARRLLAAGADVQREDEQGGSALLYSLASPELAALLLKAGARVNAATASGWTPLTWAASREEYADAIPLLLQAGAKPGQADGQGRLPLQVALDSGNGKAVALLQAALDRKARK
ncbi:MAG: ankyrin repeat domain-containing protein [Desulfovibrio sp.]|jgi:ankyrin repeat protein|nr:ankyrin repeat domain-containing protein [Desulfovibrio sp.]